MNLIDDLKVKYPGAIAWGFGDGPEMADELAELVLQGVKTAACGSLWSFQNEGQPPVIGGYSIILNGRDQPVGVIRLIGLRLVRFCDVTEEFARKEGEGDRSLDYWRQSHKAFFQREGTWTETMELVAEEFELVEVVSSECNAGR